MKCATNSLATKLKTQLAFCIPIVVKRTTFNLINYFLKWKNITLKLLDLVLILV